ncbi:hypothetical protein Glove_330g121 [Diversispora epigaea]|uniref:Uncharacterized protein n=1 Tax=Diversispora epigaea TaxID=1348612 RepID=A0A397HMZ3_9GLOM|nr:hypothetical protein Glove_330g121 [Diversispora epigaea]
MKRGILAKVRIPAKNGNPVIPHNSEVKITMITSSGECIDRPVLIKRETQDLSMRKAYDAIFWNPPEKYVWKKLPKARKLKKL